MERQLIEDYRATMEQVMSRIGEVGLEPTRDIALALARLPEKICGFGHIKAESIVGARVRWSALMRQLTGTPEPGATKTVPVHDQLCASVAGEFS